MGDLSTRDIERASFAFSVYDFNGDDTVDAFDLGSVLRSLGLLPSQALVTKLGGTVKKGEKKLKVEEFLTVFSECKKVKDSGNAQDFKEILRLYDKQEDGTMFFDELKHILLSLGEKLENAEVDEILKDCAMAADGDGFTPYGYFLDKLMTGPYKEED